MGVLARTVARRALAGSAGLPAPHTAIPIPDDWPAAVVAAARVIGIADNRTEARKLIERQAKWQEHAFDYYTTVPEVQNGVDFIGNAMSKLIIYPAIKPAGPNDQPEEDNDPRALDALRRLEGPLGGHSEILRAMGIHFSAPGECYLIGRELEDGTERWEIRAKSEVKAGADGAVVLVDGGDSKDKVILDENSMISRMWKPHPQRAWQATSSLRGVLSQCEELLILDRMCRAVERSRNNAGILKVPTEMLTVKREMPGTEAALAAQEGNLVDELLEALGQPITDEGHANAIVPHILSGPAKELEAIDHMMLGRTLDAWIDTRTARVQRRFAIGFNLPVEVTTGAEGLSGWTKFSVDEDGFKSYLLPFVLLGLSSLTTGYYHPMLRAAGVEDWQDRIIWYDAQRLIARINAFKEASELHEAGVIRDEDFRRAGGFGDESIPSEEEIQRRILWKSAGRQQGPPGTSEEADEAAPEPEGPEDQASIAAGARGQDPELARLARRQADLDRQLYARLEAAFEAAIDKVLERAGTKVVSKSKGRGKAATAAAIRDVATRRAAATLGPAVVAQLGLTEDDLLRGAFDDLEDRFRTWVGQAQAAALDLVPDLERAERVAAEADLAAFLNEAWAWTRGALTDLARERLYDPDPRTPDDGEHDASATVPFRLVREAVARAGGATGPDAPVVAAGFLDPMRTAVGLATGWLMQRLFRSRGVVTEGWEWEYGPYPRTSEFEPHADLDGTVFVNFDDAVLTNGESWPSYEHFFPGDHGGCRCVAAPVLVRVGR